MELRENVGCMLHACCMEVIDVVWRLYMVGIMVEMTGGWVSGVLKNMNKVP
jgi:hypothetical protein